MFTFMFTGMSLRAATALKRLATGHPPGPVIELGEVALGGAAFFVAFGIESRRSAAGSATIVAVFFWSSFTGMTALIPRLRR
jgi:hypothetical protein